MGENVDGDMVGEYYLFSRLHRLADTRLQAPLVALSGDPTSMRGCEVSLTDIGRAVFDGYENFVRLNGDDWVLGVHLDSTAGKVWYRQDDGWLLDDVMKSPIRKIDPAEFILSALSPKRRFAAAMRMAHEAFKKTALTMEDIEAAVEKVRRKRDGARNKSIASPLMQVAGSAGTRRDHHESLMGKSCHGRSRPSSKTSNNFSSQAREKNS
jgi:hypothetical protein